MPQAQILVVRSEKSKLGALEKSLSALGHQVTTCNTAAAAIAQLRSEPPHLVIIDGKLPETSAEHLLAFLKSAAPTSELPCVLVSTKDSSSFWSRFATAVVEAEADPKKAAEQICQLLPTSQSDVERMAARNHPLIPDLVGSESSASSNEKLISALLMERMVDDIVRRLNQSVDDRVEFVRILFDFINRVFQPDLCGMIIADPASHWALYDVKTCSRATFEKVQASAAKSLGLSMQPRVMAIGELVEKGGPQYKTQDVVPVFNKYNRIVGGLVLCWSGKHQNTDEQKTIATLLQTHMRPVFKALFDLQQIQALQKQYDNSAYMDPLTGLYNLEFLIGFLQQQLLFSKRQKLQVGLLLLDIDNFLNTNNEHGPDTGDMVLMSLANRLNKSVRSSDLVARYSIDQFAIVLPNTDAAGVKVVGEKIRSDIEKLKWESLTGKALSVTASLGGANFDLEDASPETLLRDAKRALLSAKANGRNKVVVGPVEKPTAETEAV